MGIGAPRECRCQEALGAIRGVRGGFGAGRGCRYSGASRGKGSIKEHWGY